MDAIECIKNRRSVRSFSDKGIPDKELKDIVDCGRLAPSANNKQPWSFILVKNQEKLEKLGELCTYGGFISDASACIVVVGEEDEKYVLEDGFAATENILLAAKAKGYGGCWVAGHGKDYAEEVLELLDARNMALISLIPLGIPTKEPTIEKKSLEKVLYREEMGDT